MVHTVKNLPAVRETGSIPGPGRSSGGENGYPLQYSYLENSMDRPWGHKELDMTEQITLKNSFPGSSVVKNPLANAGDTGSIPGPGRSS